jgi:hypothetical protein
MGVSIIVSAVGFFESEEGRGDILYKLSRFICDELMSVYEILLLLLGET